MIILLFRGVTLLPIDVRSPETRTPGDAEQKSPIVGRRLYWRSREAERLVSGVWHFR